ncbi:MAG: cryptochrome/photolyase family protein [Woeseiaceae bacterium]|nr:cryptochrome/photolyase family protein [Woeseiaceae bacterium]
MIRKGRGLLILGNQLFPLAELAGLEDVPVYMAEDRGLCTRVRHHQQKLVLILAAMREYDAALRERGFHVTYRRLCEDEPADFEAGLLAFVTENRIGELVSFEIEDHFFEERMQAFCDRHSLCLTFMQSPMFLTRREDFADYLQKAGRPFMASFYRQQRRRLSILLDDDGEPAGGRWSFDEVNRQPLPADCEIPGIPETRPTDRTAKVMELVQREFPDHPGRAEDFCWPVTRRSALYWLRDFLAHRFAGFGPYQDAITRRSETAFHSVLAPMLNTGLITPRDVVDQSLAHAQKHDIPLASLEGFIRQVIGWREFIRGIYRHFDSEMSERNFWDHRRGLACSWYDGTTGIPPLDNAIRTALRLGWTHHINRLMVIGNLMNLCEIEPRQVHAWFMETHIDSSEWVMGPNVYGMALYSDGGIFATKPYLCASNYLLKMSDYGKGDWCDVVDGLYWRFIDRHREFFAANQRLSMMVKTLEKQPAARRERIFNAAAHFLERHTIAASGGADLPRADTQRRRLPRYAS